MTPAALLAECDRAEAQGLAHLLVMIPYRKGARARQAQIAPGLRGKRVGSTFHAHAPYEIILLDAAEVRRWATCTGVSDTIAQPHRAVVHLPGGAGR